MKKILYTILSISFLSLSSCTDSNGATRTLINNGYTNVEITGYRFFSGGRDDVFVTGFEAISPAGIPVSGVVTRGWFNGNTIRLD